MRKFALLLICLTSLLVSVSCGNHTWQGCAGGCDSTTTANDTVPANEKDSSLSSAEVIKLVERQDDLKAELDSLAAKQEEILKTLDEEENGKTWTYICWACIALCIIGVLLTNKKTGKLQKEIRRIQDKQPLQSQQLCKQTKPQEDYNKQQHSIVELEKTMKSFLQTLTTTETRISNLESQQRKDYTNKCPNPALAAEARDVYADINSENYFAQISESEKDTSVFVIKTEKGGNGFFHLISLDRIKSRDQWKAIVKYDGCSNNEAKSFKEIEPGECKQVDGIWKVTKELKIKFFK